VIARAANSSLVSNSHSAYTAEHSPQTRIEEKRPLGVLYHRHADTIIVSR
jgi:hypothetical protein